jgi:hypothetical protein
MSTDFTLVQIEKTLNAKEPPLGSGSIALTSLVILSTQKHYQPFPERGIAGPAVLVRL